MSEKTNATTECRLLAEYVDQGQAPADGAYGAGDVVRPQIVGEYVDEGMEDAPREFTVLLRNGGTVSVRGHSLKHWLPQDNDDGSYGVLLRTRQQEVLIALFRTAEVVGIFDGALRLTGARG